MIPAFLLSIAFFSACSQKTGGVVPDTGAPDSDADADSDTDTDTDSDADTDVGDCTVTEILEVSPADDATVIPTLMTLVFTVDGTPTEDGTEITLADATGDVPFTLTVADGQVVATPDAELLNDTTYAWTASICDVTAAGAFSTTPYGDPPPVNDLIGATFAFDITTATWVEPPGVGSIIGMFWQQAFLLGVQDVADDTVDTILGVATDRTGAAQDMCFETVDFPPADYSAAPYWIFGPADVPLTFSGMEMNIKQASLAGAFTDDADQMVDGRLTGQLDVRDLGDADNYCSYLGMFGMSCTTCDSDGTPYCVNVDVQDIQGDRVEGMEIVEVLTPGPGC